MCAFNEKDFTFQGGNGSFEFCLCSLGEISETAQYVTSHAQTEENMIEYIVSGCGYIETNGITSKVNPGDCFFIRRGSEYRFRSDKESPCHKLLISIDGTLVENWLNLYDITLTPYIKRLDISRQWAKLKELSALPESDDTELNITLTVHAILFRLSRTGVQYDTLGKFDGSAYRDRRKLILDVKKYIEKNAADGVNLDELAMTFCISKSQLIKLFKKQYGLTPYAYASECRIHAARTLLEASSASVDEIASKLGFFDRNHFTKAFIASYGCTPSAYRKEKELKHER